MSTTSDLHQSTDRAASAVDDTDDVHVDVDVDDGARGVEAAIDGRTARAVRTRTAIVDATLALVEEGDVRPTGPRIAERAGVSVRSVFQHFDDLEGLFTAVGARLVERLARLVRPIDPTCSLAERTAQFVRQRCEVNEAVSPVNRAAVVHAPGSVSINRQFQAGHDFARLQVTEAFAPELAAADDSGLLLDALLVATSWTTWNLLRRLEHRSVEDAAGVVDGLVRLALRGAAVDSGSDRP